MQEKYAKLTKKQKEDSIHLLDLSGWENLKKVTGLNLSFAEEINIDDTFDFNNANVLFSDQ